MLPDDGRELGLGRAAEGILERRRHAGERASVARDRISADAAVERDEPERSCLVRGGEHSAERLDGVYAAGGDVASRVAALRAGQLDAADDGVRGHGLCGELHAEERVVASGAADGERAVARPVDVHEQSP